MTLRFFFVATLAAFLTACSPEPDHVHDPAFGATRPRSLGPFDQPTSQVAFSLDSKLLAAANADGSVRLWNWPQATLARTLTLPAGATGIAFGPDGQLITSRGEDKVVRAVSPDGQWIAIGSDDSTIRISKASDGSLVRTLRGTEHVYAVAFSPDSRWLVTGSQEKGALGTRLKRFVGRLGMGVAPTVHVWRMSDGALVQALDDPRDDIHSVTFSPDGRWLAAGGKDHMLTVWRLQPPVPPGR